MALIVSTIPSRGDELEVLLRRGRGGELERRRGAANGEDDAREVAFFKPTTGCRLLLDIEFFGSASTSSQAPSTAGGGGELVELGLCVDREGTER